MWIPLEFTKWVFKHPSSFALLFIISQNASTEPEICSASAVAASLADGISKTFNSCSTVSLSPSCKVAWVYPTGTEKIALWLIVTTSLNSQFSKVNIAVISLVVLAGNLFSWAFLEYNIFPVLASINKTDGEFVVIPSGL